MSSERGRFEAREIAELARQHGAKRVMVEPGIYAWRFPAWVCPHCGPDAEVQPGCPEPLARHGRLKEAPRRESTPWTG